MVQYIKTYVLDFVCKGLNLFQPKLNFLNILVIKNKKKTIECYRANEFARRYSIK